MNRPSVYENVLRQSRDEMATALEHMDYSYQKVAGLELKDKWTENELESLEAFTSRFARVVDLLVHRLLRAIDRYELLDPGTLLDAANRAESRDLIPSVDWLRELKDTRNRIAHDYAGEDFKKLVSYCIRVAPELRACLGKISEYIECQVGSGMDRTKS